MNNVIHFCRKEGGGGEEKKGGLLINIYITDLDTWIASMRHILRIFTIFIFLGILKNISRLSSSSNESKVR